MPPLLPVSVIVPHTDASPKRVAFLRERCLPAIEAQGVAEVIVEPGPEGAQVKRNRGAAKAKQPFLLFVDDDDVLLAGAVRKMHHALEMEPSAAFAYGQWAHVYYDDPFGRTRVDAVTRGWDAAAITWSNFIPTESMIRREWFPGWDESLTSSQEWDLWWTIAERGGYGVYLAEQLLEAHHFDAGLTKGDNDEGRRGRMRVMEKHRLSVAPARG